MRVLVCAAVSILMSALANLASILGVELLCASQGIECRAPMKTSAALQKVLARLRADVPSLGTDRYMATEMKTAAGLVASADVVRATGNDHLIDWSN